MSASPEQAPPDEVTVAAYLSDRLSPASAEALEAYCLRHPEFAQRVEADLLLKVGFRQMEGSWWRRVGGHRRRSVLAIAAGLILVAGGSLLLLSRVHTGLPVAYRSQTELPASLLSGPRVELTLIRLRGGSAVHRIIAPRGAALLAVRIAPDSPPGPGGYAVRVALDPEPIPRSVTLDKLQADADGYLDLYLPLSGLLGRTFRITANASPAAGTESMPFRLQVLDAQNAPPSTP